ncbi:MAG: site-specific integrase [Actinobacteria bacterium]|nr:site-specific integrase [Actinomycetota bacterium]
MEARVRVGTVSGPLTPFAPGFELWLAARGYSPSAVMHRRWLFDHLNRWLVLEGLRADELTAERAEQFLQARRVAGYATWVSPRSMALPLEYLREVGAVPSPAAVVAEGPLEQLLVGYRGYLVLERGLAQSTIAEYERVARLFLGQRPGGLALEELAAADVSGFLARECPRRSVAGARHLVSPLRSLLRYLHVAGLIGAPLVWAVPGVADLRDRSLPRGVDPAVVARLLASCDRRRTVGRRDYAILLLLVRLGLRVGEVAAIELDDLDWRRGEILIRGKGDRHDRLPLPVDVGEALVSYLRRRGRDGCRALFLKVHAPAGALCGNTVCGVVGDACVRAGVPRVGAHRLRHTAATAMLRRGASLAEIAQVLRHREIKTTAIYAKVDRSRLRALAQPWPGGGGS